MADEFTATDGVEEAAIEPANAVVGPTPEKDVAPVVEPAPEAVVEPAPVPSPEVPSGDRAADLARSAVELYELGQALTHRDAKSRALRTLLQSGLVSVAASTVVAVEPLVKFGHMTEGDWKAIGLLAASTAGTSLMALLHRLVGSDPSAK